MAESLESHPEAAAHYDEALKLWGGNAAAARRQHGGCAAATRKQLSRLGQRVLDVGQPDAQDGGDWDGENHARHAPDGPAVITSANMLNREKVPPRVTSAM